MSAALKQVPPAAAVAAPKKPRAKRNRKFLLEYRTVPCVVATHLALGDATDWVLAGRFAKLDDARRNSIPTAPGYFTRGTEFRVRRTDSKVA